MKKYVVLLLVLSALIIFGFSPSLGLQTQAADYTMFSLSLGAGTDVCVLLMRLNAPFLDDRTQNLLERFTQSEVVPEEPERIRVAAVGDLMCHASNLEAALNPVTGEYDFIPFFEYVRPFIQSAELAAANFETTLGGDLVKPQGYPRFSSPDAYLYAVLHTGFDVLTNANNHCLDHGAEALKRTNERLAGAGAITTGSSTDANRRAKPAIVEAKGIKFGFAAYTYGSNRTDRNAAVNQLYVKNKLNTADISADIAELKRQGADVVILCVHWGAEYTASPSARMQSDAKALAELGADVILGHHPHSLHPVSMLTRRGRVIPVVYSMGNFFCNPSKESCTAEGAIVLLDFEKRGGGVVFTGLEYVPTYIRRTRGQKTDYDILPLVGAQSDKTLEAVRKRIISRIGKSAMLRPAV